MHLAGKHILVGISGGIAAYKIPELIRLLKKAGAEVKVTTTKNALQFVTNLTLQTLSGYPVYSDVFAAINEHSTEHISLPDWADLMVIAPATANVINKIAHGIADDALTTTFCAMRKPVVIAPAMNDKMYLSPATQASLQTLSEWENITLLDCASGELACGTTGRGRMQEVNIIAETIEYALTEKKLQNKQILITAGPTQEQLDPVRYISNYSTGKMGYALARACLMQGADVSLVSGPTHLQVLPIPLFLQEKQVHLYNVCSAQEMYISCETIFPKADITILCAAVADFTPTNIADKKIKKESGQTEMTLSLSTTVDIAATLGAKKRDNQIVVGFALETDHEKEHALAKMQKKNLNFIVLNSLRDSGAGFGHDTNKVTILSNDGEEKNFPLMSKEEVAQIIVSHTLLP